MSGDPARLLPDVDRMLDIKLDRKRAALGTVMTATSGGDPLVDPPAFGYPKFAHVEIERRMNLEIERNQKMGAMLSSPESGWGDIQSFMDEVFTSYKTRNESRIIKKPKNEQEALELAQSMVPVRTDPNKTAMMRQKAVKLDQMMKAIDPRTSFWTDPRTKRYADWLNRESGPGEAGFMQSGEQPVELGWARPAVVAWQGIEGMAAPAGSIINGIYDNARKTVLALGGPDIAPAMATNYIEAEDGTLVHNGGKVPSIMDGILATWAFATNQNIEKYAAAGKRTQEWELANRAGFAGLATSISRLGGELVGMAPIFGTAAKIGEATVGTLSMKGLQALGTLRLAKTAEQSARALKIITFMSKGLGQASGMATYEMIANGNAQGYADSFMHGLMMAPVLMTLGALGKKTEWFAQNRTHMPGAAARLIAGAMEGAGFAGVETTFPNLLPQAWGFIRDPNQNTWEAFAKNMLAFGLVKMGTGRTMMGDREMLVHRNMLRSQFAAKLASGEAKMDEAPAALRTAEGEAKLRQLADVQARARAGDQAALGEQLKVEEELGILEQGKGPGEREAAEFENPLDRAEIPLETDLPGHEREVPVPEGLPEQVSGKEPGKIRPRASEPGGRPAREGMVQEGGREGLEPERMADEGPEAEQAMVEGIERRISQSRDPLEDPRFMELPEALRKEIHAAKDVEERKRLASGKMAERRVAERRGEPRGTEAPMPSATERSEKASRETISQDETKAELGRADELETQAEVRAPAPGRRGSGHDEMGSRRGPGSLQQPPNRQLNPSEGIERTSQPEIMAAMAGRPARRGVRIPLTGIRVGADEGDPVKVAIRGGHVGGGGRLGFFETFKNLFRTQEGRDIVVSAHEWSHAMHRHGIGPTGGRAFIAAAQAQARAALQGPHGPAIANEMQAMLANYPGAHRLPLARRWMETWAEWHARNLLGEVGLDGEFPALSHYMRAWLNEPAQARIAAQYNRIQDLIFRYNAQGAEARFEGTIVNSRQPLGPEQRAQQKNPIVKFIGRLNKAFFDDLADLKKSQDQWIRAAGRLPEDVNVMDDPARLLDIMGMTAPKTTEHFINRGVRLPGMRSRVPGLRSVMNAVQGRTWDFQKFVVALRTHELWRTGHTIQLPIRDIRENLRILKLRHPDFPQHVKALKNWTDAIVDYAAMSGSIGPEDAQRIKDAYVVYVPFFRAIEGPAQQAQGRGVAERGSGMGRIEGSTYEIKDPFIALQDVVQSIISKAHQYVVTSGLYKMSHGYEAGGVASIVKRTSVPKDHPLADLITAIERGVQLPPHLQGALGPIFDALRQVDALNPQTITLFSQKVIPTGERAVIAFTPRLSEAEIIRLGQEGANVRELREQNDKLQWLDLDTKVYEAMMGVDKMPHLPARLQPMMKALTVPRDIVRFFATGVAPGFVAANVVRDVLSAPLFDREGRFRPLGGIWRLVRGAYHYHQALPGQLAGAVRRGDLRGLREVVTSRGQLGPMRELYEELGAKTSSFWTEGRKRELIGERMSIWQHAKAWANTTQDFFAHPENYIRMDEFVQTYRGALREGRSVQEARLLALEGAREITVNFARAGVWARVMNQAIPYFNAGLQGQRKLWGTLFAGGVDTKSDAMKARIQRGAVLNGIANITVPAALLWLMNKDEDWYQDLPEWRKLNYFNMKFGDQIISVPKPFEAGTLFGSIPEMLLDQTFGDNPIKKETAILGLIGPYLDIGWLMPSVVKPLFELKANKNLFTGRPLVPEWISRATPPEEQATFYTTEVAKIMGKVFGVSPIKIEHLMGGYTAGASTVLMRAMDEIAGLRDHPGIALNPLQRFTSQQVHGQSSYVDQLYDLSVKLDQHQEGESGVDKGLRQRVDRAKEEISALRKRYREGRMNQVDAERRMFEIAKPLVKRSEQR